MQRSPHRVFPGVDRYADGVQKSPLVSISSFTVHATAGGRACTSSRNLSARLRRSGNRRKAESSRDQFLCNRSASCVRLNSRVVFTGLEGGSASRVLGNPSQSLIRVVFLLAMVSCEWHAICHIFQLARCGFGSIQSAHPGNFEVLQKGSLSL